MIIDDLFFLAALFWCGIMAQSDASLRTSSELIDAVFPDMKPNAPFFTQK